MLPFRNHLDATDVVLLFLVVVVAAAATGGLGPGVTAAVLGFLATDVLFVRPYGTLLVSKAQDLVSLAVYLLVTLVVSALVGTSEQRRMRAQQRERETHVLYELSASLVAHGSLDARQAGTGHHGGSPSRGTGGARAVRTPGTAARGAGHDPDAGGQPPLGGGAGGGSRRHPAGDRGGADAGQLRGAGGAGGGAGTQRGGLGQGAGAGGDRPAPPRPAQLGFARPAHPAGLRAGVGLQPARPRGPARRPGAHP